MTYAVRVKYILSETLVLEHNTILLSVSRIWSLHSVTLLSNQSYHHPLYPYWYISLHFTHRKQGYLIFHETYKNVPLFTISKYSVNFIQVNFSNMWNPTNRNLYSVSALSSRISYNSFFLPKHKKCRPLEITVNYFWEYFFWPLYDNDSALSHAIRQSAKWHNTL